MSLATTTQGRGPELFMLHGWAMHSGIMGAFARRLAPYRRVTQADLPGHGHSEDIADSDLDAWAWAALDAAPPRATWLAWSMGGLVALRAAQLAPRRIQGLVMMASSPSFVRRDDGWPGILPPVLETFARTLSGDAQQTVVRFLSVQMNNDPGGREHLRQLRQAVASAPAATPRALAAGLAFLREIDLRAGLIGLPMPTLWIYGGRDTLVPAAGASALASLQPQAQTLVLHGSGHLPFDTDADACEHAVLGFAGV